MRGTFPSFKALDVPLTDYGPNATSAYPSIAAAAPGQRDRVMAASGSATRKLKLSSKYSVTFSASWWL